MARAIINFEVRKKIEECLKNGASISFLSSQLNISEGTIRSEIYRNGNPCTYTARKAQRRKELMKTLRRESIKKTYEEKRKKLQSDPKHQEVQSPVTDQRMPLENVAQDAIHTYMQVHYDQILAKLGSDLWRQLQQVFASTNWPATNM